MGIVFGTFLLRETVHLEGNEFQTLLLEPGDYLSGKSPLQCAGLDYHKCSFHI